MYLQIENTDSFHMCRNVYYSQPQRKAHISKSRNCTSQQLASSLSIPCLYLTVSAFLWMWPKVGPLWPLHSCKRWLFNYAPAPVASPECFWIQILKLILCLWNYTLGPWPACGFFIPLIQKAKTKRQKNGIKYGCLMAAFSAKTGVDCIWGITGMASWIINICWMNKWRIYQYQVFH